MSINHYIKTFIEDNIKYIEKEQWFFVFAAWAAYVKAERLWPDTMLIKQLFDVLIESKVVTEYEATEIKHNMLRTFISDLIQTKKDEGIHYLELFNIVYSLDTAMGLFPDEVENITLDLAEEQGIKIDSDGNRLLL